MEQKRGKVKISPYRGKGTELIKMHNTGVQIAQKAISAIGSVAKNVEPIEHIVRGNPFGLVKNFAEKIVFGTVNWMFHLVSDIDGSSSSVFEGSGKGTGIPGPFLSLLKELSALPLFDAVDEKNINKFVNSLINSGATIETMDLNFHIAS